VAQGLIDTIGMVVDLKSQDMLRSFDGSDIDQRRQYGKVSCHSYLVRLLKTHGWNKPSSKEKYDSKPIEGLVAFTTADILLQSGRLAG
jgi:hypothetical protein